MNLLQWIVYLPINVIENPLCRFQSGIYCIRYVPTTTTWLYAGVHLAVIHLPTVLLLAALLQIRQIKFFISSLGQPNGGLDNLHFTILINKLNLDYCYFFFSGIATCTLTLSSGRQGAWWACSTWACWASWCTRPSWWRPCAGPTAPPPCWAPCASATCCSPGCSGTLLAALSDPLSCPTGRCC